METSATSRGDLYAVLGVDRGASESEIKGAYRRLALKHHPDKARSVENNNRGSGGGGAADDAVFKEASFAYSVLSDPTKKKYYDETGDTEDVDVTPEDFVRYVRACLRSGAAETRRRDSRRRLLDNHQTRELASFACQLLASAHSHERTSHLMLAGKFTCTAPSR